MCAFIFFGPRTLCGARMGRRKLSLFEQMGRDRWKESELFLCCVRKRSEQPLSISIECCYYTTGNLDSSPWKPRQALLAQIT